MNTTEALSYNTVESAISNHRLFNFSQDDISLMRDNMFTFFYDLRDLSEKSIVMEIKDEDKAEITKTTNENITRKSRKHRRGKKKLKLLGQICTNFDTTTCNNNDVSISTDSNIHIDTSELLKVTYAYTAGLTNLGKSIKKHLFLCKYFMIITNNQ